MGCESTKCCIKGERVCSRLEQETKLVDIDLIQLYNYIEKVVYAKSHEGNITQQSINKLFAQISGKAISFLIKEFPAPFHDTPLSYQDLTKILEHFNIPQVHKSIHLLNETCKNPDDTYNSVHLLLLCTTICKSPIEDKIFVLFKLAECTSNSSKSVDKSSILNILNSMFYLSSNIIPKFCTDEGSIDDLETLKKAFDDCSEDHIGVIMKQLDDVMTLEQLYTALKKEHYIFSSEGIRESLYSCYLNKKTYNHFEDRFTPR